MVSTTEIAKYAGVSQTTVSRVLNKPDQVKRETYDKVMAAINEWGYSAEPKEKIEELKATKTIRILASANDSVIYQGAMQEIVNSAAEQGMLVNIHVFAAGGKEALYNELTAQGTAGVIVSSMSIEEELADKLKQSRIPFVLLNGGYSENGYSVSLDYSEAGYLAASHFINSGHQEIAWIGGTLDTETNKDGLLGFVHALQANNHKIRKKRLVVTHLDKASLYAAFESLMVLKKKPTAIVAASDNIAIQLMEFLQIAGLEVPKDISIIGIGNSTEAGHPDNKLTSIGISATNEELGKDAISLLFQSISAENAELRNVKKKVELIERQTTKLLLVKK
ncbi:LacI family transcriptional regulator/LacI family purine nucleotide synthesis repressor [Planomicrobium sp. HSC-17F08]|nr:LacI family transcriptional regulator/LacI family purine nucleotide synthesis repressor [Planomicrobium sp. HSC-17F08]